MTELQGWLRKGLGRAAIFVKTHPAERYRASLLYACTHNLAFDSQCEESRAPYLVNLIEASGDIEFYRDGILSALGADDPEVDLGQLFEVAASFAVKGDAELKHALYATFDRRGFTNAGISCAETLVLLDGLDGLLLVAKSFGDVEADERPWQFGNMVEALEKRAGKQAFPPELDRFVREWRNQEEHWERERQKPIYSRQNYETLRLSLNRAAAMAWARAASPDELALVAGDLRVETDEERLVTYLRMFRRHAFPHPIDRLLDLAHSKNDRVARAAQVALSNVADGRVRALALDLMKAPEGRAFAVGLLTRNSEPGDYRTLEGLLEETIDPFIYHAMGVNVRRFAKANRSEEAERSLLLLYENGPCSLCRHGAVEELIAIYRLPVSVRDECHYDTDSGTRKLALSLRS
jgi:hypothetical protein